jgi:uncharacterized protein
MSDHEQWFPGSLRDIPLPECLELVASRPVGRISYCSAHGPVTVPVNHVSIDRDILLRTSPHSDLGQHLLEEPRVCYQVDDFDEFNQSGWSVLIQGLATIIQPSDLPTTAEHPAPWVEGARTLHIRIRGDTIAGRRVLAS